MEILDTDTLSAEVLEKALTIAGESGLLAVADAALEATSSPGQAAQIVGNVVDVPTTVTLLPGWLTWSLALPWMTPGARHARSDAPGAGLSGQRARQTVRQSAHCAKGAS